ncbi:MAG: KTSC domain-containing protein [Rhizobiales bacterium]|nr:KTSC domain-containing protein [Hyphomicrobiales bacterium]
MPEVASTAISRLSYNPARHELHVRFRESGDYVYFNVPPEEYDALIEAPSKGSFVNQRIKTHYRCQRRGAPRRRIWIDA